MALENPHFRIVIPARYASHRLPGKPLLLIDNKTMLEHVYSCARQTGAAQIVIATDDERIANVAVKFAESVCMTSPDHPSGTDRIAEVATRYGWSDDEIVVNLQGDEPLMPAALISQVAGNLFANRHASISTLCTPMTDISEYSDASKVKVVFDRTNIALYLGRLDDGGEKDATSASPIRRRDSISTTSCWVVCRVWRRDRRDWRN